MQLTVNDAARTLNVGEKTILRWIESGALPAYTVAGEYRINRAMLLEWATGKRLGFADPASPADSPLPSRALPALGDAMRLGGVYSAVPGGSVDEVLDAFVERMDLPESVRRPFLADALKTRERLQSTGIGEGIAFPHLRNPGVLGLTNPMVFTAYLENPVDYGALDGQPVDVLFCPLSPDLRIHLHLLSRLAYALRQPSFVSLVRARAPSDALAAAADALDVPPPAASAP